MASCTGCGTPLPSDAIFCPKCAQRVPAQPAAPAAASPVATISGIETIPGVSLPKAGATLADGEVFHERYTIERQLGAGAMGVVYAAKDQVTNRQVALKLINPALADRPTARERFVREGLMARDVRHANVVAMYDVGEAAGQVYLVMEYLGGETLRKWLHRTLQDGCDISFDVARGIIRAVLEGLAAAHATGVVHRDLKPENVMLAGDPNAGDYRLKILDFGIARAVGTTSHVTTTSSSTGTPLYMAPEQKTAADTVGPAADLYAVTAMLYELLIGVAPEGRWGVPSRERPDLPPGIDAVIETGLANRPRSRYQTAVEYIGVLDAVGGAVFTPPPADPPKPVPPTEPVRLLDSVSKLSRATALPGTWALWDRLTKKQRLFVGVALLLAALVGIAVYVSEEMGRYTPPVTTVDPPVTPPEGEQKPPDGVKPTPPPEPTPQPPMNIAGRWSDEVTGTGVVVTYVDVLQQGNAVSGVIWNSAGLHAGTFSGAVQGTNLEYGYVADNGFTGTGRGALTADGMHLDIVVRDNATGRRERHTLHRNHVPPQ